MKLFCFACAITNAGLRMRKVSALQVRRRGEMVRVHVRFQDVLDREVLTLDELDNLPEEEKKRRQDR